MILYKILIAYLYFFIFIYILHTKNIDLKIYLRQEKQCELYAVLYVEKYKIKKTYYYLKELSYFKKYKDHSQPAIIYFYDDLHFLPFSHQKFKYIFQLKVKKWKIKTVMLKIKGKIVTPIEYEKIEKIKHNKYKVFMERKIEAKIIIGCCGNQKKDDEEWLFIYDYRGECDYSTFKFDVFLDRLEDEFVIRFLFIDGINIYLLNLNHTDLINCDTSIFDQIVYKIRTK